MDKRLSSIYKNMRQRCYNKNAPNYKYYGGKGIKVCDEWQDKSVFIQWAYANGYTEKLTLERKKNNEDYSPRNCEWIPLYQQTVNRSSRIGKSGFRGVSYHQHSNKWRVRITIHKKTYNIGYFNSVEAAIDARIKADKEYAHLY